MLDSRSEVLMCVVREDFVRGFDSLRGTISEVDSPPIIIVVCARQLFQKE